MGRNYGVSDLFNAVTIPPSILSSCVLFMLPLLPLSILAAGHLVLLCSVLFHASSSSVNPLPLCSLHASSSSVNPQVLCSLHAALCTVPPSCETRSH